MQWEKEAEHPQSAEHGLSIHSLPFFHSLCKALSAEAARVSRLISCSPAGSALSCQTLAHPCQASGFLSIILGVFAPFLHSGSGIKKAAGAVPVKGRTTLCGGEMETINDKKLFIDAGLCPHSPVQEHRGFSCSQGWEWEHKELSVGQHLGGASLPDSAWPAMAFLVQHPCPLIPAEQDCSNIIPADRFKVPGLTLPVQG